MSKDIESCPECGVGVGVKNGKFVRHEICLAYVPYKLYHKFVKVDGGSVKEMAKRNLCPGSGQRDKLSQKSPKRNLK